MKTFNFLRLRDSNSDLNYKNDRKNCEESFSLACTIVVVAVAVNAIKSRSKSKSNYSKVV